MTSTASPEQSGWRIVLKAIQFRSRFVAVIVLLALLATFWPWLTHGWERIQARLTPFVFDSTVASGREFFCPMDPGVKSDWPAICPICNMDLISRRKGEAMILPSGVVARMQLTPYRIGLAGIRTVQVEREAKAESKPLESEGGNGNSWVIPMTSVVHWGSNALVYVESTPGMFDGVPVQLVCRQGDTYIVTADFNLEQRIVAIGTLLVDAETRLNPHLSTQYFGATAQASHVPPKPTQRKLMLSKTLDANDQRIVDAQRFCPVTKMELGSMGTPVFVDVENRKIALCCVGCERAILKDPTKYLTWLADRLKKESESK